jgi:hypothetical protein
MPFQRASGGTIAKQSLKIPVAADTKISKKLLRQREEILKWIK